MLTIHSYIDPIEKASALGPPSPYKIWVPPRENAAEIRGRTAYIHYILCVMPKTLHNIKCEGDDHTPAGQAVNEILRFL